MDSLVYGVGVNDADYFVHPMVMGKRVKCPYYKVWHSMLERCYCPKLLAKRPTYLGCTVEENWKTFSNFKRWMEKQNWQGKHLDKDLLIAGNKVYSERTCVFIDAFVNSFLTDRAARRGDYLIGVEFHNRSNKYRARCRDGLRGKHLGMFNTEIEAHLAWKTYKHQIACKLAEEQTDHRVVEALRQRYL